MENVSVLGTSNVVTRPSEVVENVCVVTKLWNTKTEIQSSAVSLLVVTAVKTRTVT